MSGLAIALIGTPGTLAQSAIIGVLAMLGSLGVAWLASRTTLRAKEDDTIRDITQSVTADGEKIRKELWERFEEADERERLLTERVHHQEIANRELHWQLDKLKAEHAAERVTATVEVERLHATIERLKTEHEAERARLTLEIAGCRTQIEALLGEVTRLREGTAPA